jgi:putative endonuclease
MTAVSTVVRARYGRSAAWRMALGRRGEQLAARHLERTGLTVLMTNWRCREGELDIIATDGRQLVVCEVKTRSGPDYGLPEEAVTERKRDRVRKATNLWLQRHKVAWVPVRFDVVSILFAEDRSYRLQHFEDAF